MEVLNTGQEAITVDPTAYRLFDANRLEMPPVAPQVAATRISGQHSSNGGWGSSTYPSTAKASRVSGDRTKA